MPKTVVAQVSEWATRYRGADYGRLGADVELISRENGEERSSKRPRKPVCADGRTSAHGVHRHTRAAPISALREKK
jgi:hypothetical protein